MGQGIQVLMLSLEQRSQYGGLRGGNLVGIELALANTALCGPVLFLVLEVTFSVIFTGHSARDGKSLVENVIGVAIPASCPSFDPALRHSPCSLLHICLSLKKTDRTAPVISGLHPGRVSLWALAAAQAGTVESTRDRAPRRERRRQACRGRLLVGWRKVTARSSS